MLTHLCAPDGCDCKRRKSESRCLHFELHFALFVSKYLCYQELGLVDAFGESLEKKPTLAVDGDQATWKAEKIAKAAADKEVRRLLLFTIVYRGNRNRIHTRSCVIGGVKNLCIRIPLELFASLMPFRKPALC
jgi:hypothetical protein